MFDKHRAKKAEEDYERRLARWQELREETAHLLELAQGYPGESASEALLLAPGERQFATVTGVGLVEERRGPGHYAGASQGFSIPIGDLDGHQLRYHVAGSRGHYVQGAPTPTSVDTGTVVITDRRVVYQGAHQTRECAFAKLLGVQYRDDGSVTLSVSSRQKPTTLHYGPKIAGWVHFRLELALAHFRGSVPELVGQLQGQLSGLEAAKPVAPAPA